MEFEQVIHYRRAVRIFDSNAKFDSEVVLKSLKNCTLAPSSSNMQLWEFYHIKSKKEKDKLAEYCMNQSAAKTANELVVFVVRRDKWKSRAQFNLKKIISSIDGKNLNDISKKEKRAIHYYKSLMPWLYYDLLGILGVGKSIFASIVGLWRPMYREVKQHDLRIVAHKGVALAAQTFMLNMASEKYDTCPMEGIDSYRIKKMLALPRKAEISMVIACGIRKEEGVYHERRRVDFEEIYFSV